MTDNEFKYWAFLSCSRQDNSEKRPDTQDVSHLCWGDWLHDALKTFSIPADFAGHPNARGEIVPERIESVFQDHQEQPEGASLSTEVCEALVQSRCLIVICSPRSAKSLHVNEAVRYFKQLGRGNHILPIVIDGEPNASDGIKPGISPDAECFVPALRHPVNPDGTLDTTQRARGPIFADARHGQDKREVLATDHLIAETELEIAKIQLIAGLIGVGFNGLWRREQNRRFTGFAEAQHQAREAQSQIQEAREQARLAESKVLEAQHQAHDAQMQLEAARNQVREAQNKILNIQNLPQDVHSQIQEAQNQAQEAQNQTREVQKQLQALQAQARETQDQLEEARNQVRAAESKVLEAQSQAQNAQSQVEAAHKQAREAQSQLEAIQNQAREAQTQVSETQNLPSDVQSQIQAAQNQTQEAQNQARHTQSQLAEARAQAQDAQNKFLAAQSQVQEFQHQARLAQNQLEEARHQAREAQNKVAEIQNQTRDVQGQIQAAQNQVLEAQNQARLAQDQVQAIENKTRKARRLTKVFALIAVLTMLAAGIAASIALRQRKVASQAQAKAAAVEAGKFDLAQGGLMPEQIRQALQQFGGTEQSENRLRSLEKLAGQIPTEEIPETLKASSVILNDRQRSHFQMQLLLRLSEVNPLSAMTNADAIEGKIVNADGANTSSTWFQLAVLDNWMKTNSLEALDWVRQLPATESRQQILEKIIPSLTADNPTNALALLNDLKPASDERSYTLLFQHWATNNPVQAIEQRQQTPDHDASDTILCDIMTTWLDQQPDAALDWVKSQPDSESKNKALEICIGALAKTDFPKALSVAESLPEGVRRSTVIAGLFNDWAAKNLEAAATACQQLPDGMTEQKAWECVVNQWIAKDPASAAEQVINLGPGDYRQKAIEELCSAWADIDAPAALAWAQCLPSEAEQVAAVNQVVVSWARKDPQSALRFADLNPKLSGDAWSESAKAWAKNDFTAATNWVENLEAGEKKNAALSAMSDAWAQNDPKGMATYALNLPAGAAQNQYLTDACRQLAIHDLPQTVDLLNTFTNAVLRQSIMEQAGRSCDLLRLNQATKYIAAMPADDEQKAMIKGLISSWAPAAPETALDWLRSFPETNAQPEEVNFVIQSWSQHEPAAVANWLADLPAGTASEGMTKAFLEATIAKYPAFAAQWTQSVTDETQRQKFQLQVARQWLKADPSAAAKWINSLDFPEDIKESLMAPVPAKQALQNSNSDSPADSPVETENLLNTTNAPNAPEQIQPKK